MNLDIKKNIRALGLCSGGLDSILSALILRQQNIYVEWVSFETPFFSADKSRRAAQNYAIPLTVKNITPVYLEMLKNPPCGYGRHMNPCMDCHALMFRMAAGIMKESSFDFLFSGEVLGQRPMSQTKSSLRYVEKRSEADGYIVRPLSAKALPQTIPEKQGWINRELLFNITGRTRKPQIELAEKFGVSDYPSPAGGCLLTEQSYSLRLKDLFNHSKTQTENDLHLLKYGRHFRLSDKVKLIVGRSKSDNENIISFRNPSDIIFKTKDFPGPIALTPALEQQDRDIIYLAASICAGYSKALHENIAQVMVAAPQYHETIHIKAMNPEQIRHLII